MSPIGLSEVKSSKGCFDEVAFVYATFHSFRMRFFLSHHQVVQVQSLINFPIKNLLPQYFHFLMSEFVTLAAVYVFFYCTNQFNCFCFGSDFHKILQIALFTERIEFCWSYSILVFVLTCQNVKKVSVFSYFSLLFPPSFSVYE